MIQERKSLIRRLCNRYPTRWLLNQSLSELNRLNSCLIETGAVNGGAKYRKFSAETGKTSKALYLVLQLNEILRTYKGIK